MLHNLEVVGDGATHTLASLCIAVGAPASLAGAMSMRPPWVQVTAATTNSATAARIGDAATDAAHGTPILAGGSQFFPPVHQPGYTYSLTSIYINVAAGDKISLMWDA